MASKKRPKKTYLAWGPEEYKTHTSQLFKYKSFDMTEGFDLATRQLLFRDCVLLKNVAGCMQGTLLSLVSESVDFHLVGFSSEGEKVFDYCYV